MEFLAAVVLKMISDRLQHEIDQLDSVLGDGVDRHSRQRYTGESVLPVLDRDPEHWETVADGPAVALDGLQQIVDDLEWIVGEWLAHQSD